MKFMVTFQMANNTNHTETVVATNAYDAEYRAAIKAENAVGYNVVKTRKIVETY